MSSSVVSSAPLLPAAFCRRLLFPPPPAAAAALRLRLSSLGLACFALGSASLRHPPYSRQCWVHPHESAHAAGGCASSALQGHIRMPHNCTRACARGDVVRWYGNVVGGDDDACRLVAVMRRTATHQGPILDSSSAKMAAREALSACEDQSRHNCHVPGIHQSIPSYEPGRAFVRWLLGGGRGGAAAQRGGGRVGQGARGAAKRPAARHHCCYAGGETQHHPPVRLRSVPSEVQCDGVVAARLGWTSCSAS